VPRVEDRDRGGCVQQIIEILDGVESRNNETQTIPGLSPQGNSDQRHRFQANLHWGGGMRPATNRNESHSRSTGLTAFYQISPGRVFMDRNISRIQEHGLRSVWENEERDFTRWLTENIDLLASELGIEIEDARAEEAVGDFSADIVAREMNTGETVVIENQYNRTDHDHLGKLLTYSSGKNAGFTMWLAEEFRPEHRSVLEWLNESGPKGAKFFAIKPRVVSIEGAEERGFEFEVVVEPNEWEREVSTESLSDSERSYRQFFTEMVEAYSQRHPQLVQTQAGSSKLSDVQRWHFEGSIWMGVPSGTGILCRTLHLHTG